MCDGKNYGSESATIKCHQRSLAAEKSFCSDTDRCSTTLMKGECSALKRMISSLQGSVCYTLSQTKKCVIVSFRTKWKSQNSVQASKCSRSLQQAVCLRGGVECAVGGRHCRPLSSSLFSASCREYQAELNR